MLITVFRQKLALLIQLTSMLLLIACSHTPIVEVQFPTTVNPLIEQRADPWIYKDTDGTYYYVATAPEFDRIELRAAKSIRELSQAKETTIWNKHASGKMGAHIWAPEIHKIDGKWYIYFAAGEAENVWAIRMFALSNDSANPLEGQWYEEGQIDSGWESFALDATSFEIAGKRYLIWAQSPKDRGFKGTALWMSEMASPTELTGAVMLLTKPDLAWETVGHNVNEGAAVLIRNGKIFVTYSASATDHNYAVGLMWAEQSSDLIDPKSWHKYQQPIFYTNEQLNRFGPGHNSFTVAEDGKTDLFIYHARTYKELKGNPLTDPNRHTFVREITWSADGFPLFGQFLGDQ